MYPSRVIIYNNVQQQASLLDLIKRYLKLWLDREESANIPINKWMSIPLKKGWQKQAKDKAKIYLLGTRDKEIMDKEFDKLHEQGRME